MKYGIKTREGEEWVVVCAPMGGSPYAFETKIEAETMARILFARRPGYPENIRIVPVED